MKLCRFANIVDEHIVPYQYTSMGLVAIEATMWLLYIEDFVV